MTFNWEKIVLKKKKEADYIDFKLLKKKLTI